MKKLIWRLEERPQALDVVQMFTIGLITQEEARQILFKEEEQ